MFIVFAVMNTKHQINLLQTLNRSFLCLSRQATDSSSLYNCVVEWNKETDTCCEKILTRE